MDCIKYRDRKYCMVLYPEDERHAQAVEKLSIGGYNYALVLHDRDVDDNGELKKPHWHIVVKFKNAVWNTSVAEQLGITVNYIESCKSLDSALLYLVHFGHDDKEQYELEEVKGPLSVALAGLLADDDESVRALNIYEMIANSPGIVTYTEIFVRVCKAGLYGDFRRMGSGVVTLIAEHNREFYDEFVRCGSGKYTDACDQAHFRGFVEGYHTQSKSEERRL